MRDRRSPLTGAELDGLAWDKMDGLLPAVVQDASSGRLLMLGYMNREALERTLDSGLATFWSRSKERLWTKGESSGNRLLVRTVHEDCDADALLVLAEPEGPTCHQGTTSCFGGEPDGPGWLAELSRVVAERAAAPVAESYTRRLLDEGIGRVAQKVGEEGLEVALAAVSRSPLDVAEEMADLLYHLAVLMQATGLGWPEVLAVLRRRHQQAGAAGSN
jgi:phosphoribosyl-ATP pyrophosphohydrolase/phosphoribosyl-AMP cyclohydrolase